MKKAGKNGTTIDFFSQKNQKLLTVTTEQARAYSRMLENNPDVITYETQVRLMPERLQQLQKVGIRSSYFQQDWLTDFYITFENGTSGVREMIEEKSLNSLPEIEQLELSRRYWRSIGIRDWKTVLIGG